jgi:glutamate:Na+ symporter, ESS family
VAFSFLLLGMALICGMLLRGVFLCLAAVYIPASVLAGFLILLAGPQVRGPQTIPLLSHCPDQ